MKEKKVKSKKRFLVIISILTVFIISFIVFALYFISEANKTPAQIEDKETMLETRLMEIPDGATPSDYASNDVVAMLMWKLANTSEFKTVTTGTAKAFIATQLINNTRIVKNDKAIITTISSGFVKLGKQKYITNDKVLIRDAVKVDGTEATFDNDVTPECITTNTYIQRFGWMPFQVTGYIICDETILDISTMTCENGIYHISLSLNPDGDYAPFWYKREVLSSSGSSITPEFSSIKIEYVFDNSFRILESNIIETYKVRSMGISAETKTDCHEVFEYENVEFDNDTLNYFEGFKSLKPVDSELN